MVIVDHTINWCSKLKPTQPSNEEPDRCECQGAFLWSTFGEQRHSCSSKGCIQNNVSDNPAKSSNIFLGDPEVHDAENAEKWQDTLDAFAEKVKNWCKEKDPNVCAQIPQCRSKPFPSQRRRWLFKWENKRPPRRYAGIEIHGKQVDDSAVQPERR